MQYGQKFTCAPPKYSTAVTELILAKTHISSTTFRKKNSDTEFNANRTRGLAADTSFQTDGRGLHKRGLLFFT